MIRMLTNAESLMQMGIYALEKRAPFHTLVIIQFTCFNFLDDTYICALQESRKQGDLKNVWAEMNFAPKERAPLAIRITNLVGVHHLPKSTSQPLCSNSA